MGSCISKCRPKKTCSKPKEDNLENSVQDKVVISQASMLSSIPLSNTETFSGSSSPIHSASSLSSTLCSTTKSSNSWSTTSSESSALSCKGRSFSNEFLWSCVKENPHIIQANSIKTSPVKPVPSKIQTRNLNSPPVRPKSPSILAPPLFQHFPQKVSAVSTPQKRRHASSPAFTRQKSSRKKPDQRPTTKYCVSNRTMRSPSPSRRFGNADSWNSLVKIPRENNCKSLVDCPMNLSQPTTLSLMKKQYIRPASPNNNLSNDGERLWSQEESKSRVGTKIDEIAVAEVLSNHRILDSLPIEDIHNPHISLDCFIFI